MNEQVLSAETQEVAAPATDTQEEKAEGARQNPETGEKEAAPANQPRDFEKDAAFARLRREAEQARKDAERMRLALSKLDIKGDSSEDLYDKAEAYRSGRSLEEVRAERVGQERLKQLEEQNELLLKREYERVYADDLEAIRKAYPECKAKNIQELGEDFMKLRANGVDRLVAFEAIRAANERTKKPMPASTGSIRTTGSMEKDYYTPEEVDRLSAADYNNPKVLEKIERSFPRWKKQKG